MSRLHNLFCYSLLVLLGMNAPLGHSVTPDDDLGLTVSQSGAGFLDSDSGDVHIGLTPEQYEAGLRHLEKDLEARYARAHANDRQHLAAQLHVIQSHLQGVKQSYQKHIEDLTTRIVQLESIRGQVADDLLNRTQQALADGDNPQVEQLLQQLETQSDNVNTVTAEINYQRCQIAKDEIRYRQASTLCRSAAQLAPDRTDYLSDLAGLAYTLGEYDKAVGYYEQALANSIKTVGEDHPDVAISRNNLGTVWDAMGDYKKAIGYYEQALASDIKTFGENHPDVAIDRNNLGMAWYALGDYKKAVVYLEQALASDIKTYGENNLQVAAYHNNLAGAWYALGDYTKSHEYLDQALKIFENVLGENHPDTRGVRANYQQLQSEIQGREKESGALE
ncbi:MAG: tetratricopeptide repeat protein [Nitrosomonas sp.]|nr:tetratricopeptide repeat protein [Nitrosomonas sp.]